jgi:hypothetical protein
VLKILLGKAGLEAEKHSLNASGSEATPRYFKRLQRSEGVARILRRQKHYGGQGGACEVGACVVAASSPPSPSEFPTPPQYGCPKLRNR